MTFRALYLAPVPAMLAAAPAMAAKLVVAAPAPRAVVALPPRVLVLSFSAAPQVNFSEVTVTNAASDNPVPTGRPQAVNGQPFELVVPVSITQPGRYVVNWQIRAYNQHSTGSYSFTVTQ